MSVPSDVANNPSQGSGSRLGARAKREQKELFCQLYVFELAKKIGSTVRRRGDTAIDRSTQCRTFTHSCKKSGFTAGTIPEHDRGLGNMPRPMLLITLKTNESSLVLLASNSQD